MSAPEQRKNPNSEEARSRNCPRCHHALAVVTQKGESGAAQYEVDKCQFCAGTFFDAGEASALVGVGAEAAQWKDLWIASPGQPAPIHCPHDGTRMTVHVLAFEGEDVEVDHCETCQGLWLDRNEVEALREVVTAAGDKARRRLEGEERPGVALYLFQLFTNLPLEVWHPLRTRPVTVFALVATLIAFFIFQVLFAGEMQLGSGGWMMIPQQVMNGTNVHTVVTAAFLHGDVAHLLGNLYFLWLFGDNVEDRLGWRKFTAIYAAALVAGSLSHLLSTTESMRPFLGASGAVAGLMGAYFVLFPKVQVWMVLAFIRFRMSAKWYLGLWALFNVAMQILGGDGVAWLAHLGGFVVGAGIAAVARQSVALKSSV
jgi:membrane associated rhomboid family serine protease